MQSYLEKFGNNFIVAAFIPSLAFVSSVMFVFEPVIPDKVLARLAIVFNPFEGISGMWIFLVAIILGFTISSLNTFIYKVYEGYFILEKIKFASKPEKGRFESIQAELKEVKNQMLQLKAADIPRSSDEYQALLDKEYFLRSQLDAQFPPSDNHLLPTRFGNMFKAMEVYSGRRYGMDAVAVWPRLIHVIPDSHFLKIDQSNNQLAFLINCSLFSFAFATLCILGAGYQYFSYNFVYQKELALLEQKGMMVTSATIPSTPDLRPTADLTENTVTQPPGDTPLYFVQINLPSYVYWQRMWIYVVLGGMATFLGWFFYRAALPVVSRYAHLVRASFDLFRFDLLKQLHQDLPTTRDAEVAIWKRFSKHFVSEHFSQQFEFDYRFPPDKV